MKIREILEEKEYRNIKTEVDLYAKQMLTDYINGLEGQSGTVGEKEIFDPVWGPVEFNHGEILLLDSPLIQRLRKIKQLGLASYVYCGADYSRFSHTIGVFCLSGRMAEIISNKLAHQERAQYFVQIVRLAALFHDAGHMFFSHASERYFTENPHCKRYNEVKNALVDIQQKVNSDVALHELLSVMLVNSEAVKMLIKNVIPFLDGIACRGEDDLKEIIEYISCLIIGQAVDEKILPYHQIINGPVDADKCDYLSRDSHATNVPVAVDIFRLIHKLDVEMIEIPEAVYDSKIWEGSVGQAYYPTIRSSAVEAVSQLAMARSIMYNSVYYHQKVRTAEAMLERVLEKLDAIGVSALRNFSQILLMTDDAFGFYCYQILSFYTKEEQEVQLQHVIRDLEKINFRMLLKRACIIDENYIKETEEGSYTFEKDVLRVQKGDVFQKIEEDTKQEYQLICKVLGEYDKYNNERAFLIMGFPKKLFGDSIPNAVISYGTGDVEKAADIFQTGTWLDSRNSKNVDLYLLTNCDKRELAFLALQKVLYARYNIIIKTGAAKCSKVPNEKIRGIRKTLLGKNYYNKNLVLVSDILLEKFNSRIEAVCKKYQTFEGKQGKIVTEETVKNYIRQFMYLELSEDQIKSVIDGILIMLENGTYINREYFSKSLEKVFKEITPENERIFLCPLGGEKDSAYHMLYYLNDLRDNTRIVITKSLQEAIEKSELGQKIVFFDDGAYSGKQVSSIIEEYMGIPLEKRTTSERHVTPLNDEERKKIQERKVHIAYICFNTRNESFIKERGKEVGMEIESIKYMEDMKGKIFDESSTLFKNSEQRLLVKDCFSQIGCEILNSVKQKKIDWPEDRIEKSALGYNDAQQVVILKSNIPTYTLTALWLSDGKFNGRDWIPLFNRTDK